MLTAVRDPASQRVVGYRDPAGSNPEKVFSLPSLRDRAVIIAPLRAGTDTEKGPYLEFARDTTSLISGTVAMGSHVIDSAGGMVDTCIGEAVCFGERRVENFIRYANNLSFNSGDGWNPSNGSSVAAVADVSFPSAEGEHSDWKVTRGAQINSALRNLKGLYRPNRAAPFDLLRPVPHWVGCAITQMPGEVAQAELRVYNPAGANTTSKLVAIDGVRRIFAIQFTPPAPVRAASWSWSGGSLTITSPAHGIGSGVGVRLSGFIGSNSAVVVDGNYTLTGRTTDTITVALASDPGTMSRAGRVQLQFLFSVAADSWAATTVSSIAVGEMFCQEAVGEHASAPGEFVQRDGNPDGRHWYNAGVDGVKYYDRSNPNAYNATTGEVTTREVTSRIRNPAMGFATFPTTKQAVPDTERMSGWTPTGVTVIDYDTVGPDYANSLARMTEDTNTSNHQLVLALNGYTAYDGITVNYSIVLKYGGSANGRQWMRLFLTQLDGTVRHAWVDLVNVVKGAAQVGELGIEKLGDGSIRVDWMIPFGTGSTETAIGIAMASANNSTATFLGASKYNWVGFPNLIFGTGTSSVRPTAVPFCAAGEVPSTQGGQIGWIPVLDRIGQSDYAIQGTHVPYFDFGWSGKVSYTFPWYLVTTAPPSNVTSFNAVNFDRLGPAVRPNNQTAFGGGANARIAWDFYNGDHDSFYIFRTGRKVNAGDWIVPSSVLPDNTGAVKGYECQNSGTLGSEPSWTTGNGDTFTSGDVTLVQNNYLHSFTGGRWEATQNGSIEATAGFMGVYKIAMRTTENPPEVSCKVNGVDAPKEFPSWPGNKQRGARMKFKPKAIMLGTWYLDSLPPLAPGLYRSAAGQMGPMTLYHRDIFVWDEAIDDATMEAFNALSLPTV